MASDHPDPENRSVPLVDPGARRSFLARVGAGAALGSTSGLLTAGPAAAAAAAAPAPGDAAARIERALRIRVDAARRAHAAGTVPQQRCALDLRHPDYLVSYSKGLPHDGQGQVDAAAAASLRHALSTGDPADFERIPVGSIHMPLANPQGALCFALAGRDSSQYTLPPAPAFASDERGAEAIENYWMATLRDVPFTSYADHPLAAAACEELSALPAFRGPRREGQVTPELLFRGNSQGDLIGPYISQFLLQPIRLGALPLPQRIQTLLPIAQGGHDYLTEFEAWLSVQNGDMPMGSLLLDPVLRYIRSGRDLAAYVRRDFPYQAFLHAAVWLDNHTATVNPASPYPRNRNQAGFATFGMPDAQSMLATAHICALRAVWYQKWMVHLTPRPEEYCARVHLTLTGQAGDPIPAMLRDSRALAENRQRTAGYFLPQAYPEGSPMHPSYAQGHAACAAACMTVLKAFYDGNTRLMELGEVVEPSPDGLTLKPYRGVAAGQLTVAGELEKLAGNIGLGRDIAGIHWRSDYWQGVLLGEQVALDLLRDSRQTYSERVKPLAIRRLDGSTVMI